MVTQSMGLIRCAACRLPYSLPGPLHTHTPSPLPYSPYPLGHFSIDRQSVPPDMSLPLLLNTM